MQDLLLQYTASWDVVTSVALVYVALFVPPQVAFADIELFSSVWWLGAGVDMVCHLGYQLAYTAKRPYHNSCCIQVMDGVQMFLIDMTLRFILPFQEQQVWIADTYKIARKYLSSWFLLDFLSVFPFEIILPNQTSGCAHWK